MDTKNYLNVKLGSKSTLADQKQKSFESYDSTSSNYSQISDCSDNLLPSQRLETLRQSSPSMQLPDSISEPSNDVENGQLPTKRTFWQKTVSSFRRSKHKGTTLKRHKSVGCSSTSSGSFDKETEDMDPVYHLLRCAASHGRSNKYVFEDADPHIGSQCTDRSRTNSSSQFHNSRVACVDPKCPCKCPEKIPIIKKEDLGQQAKKLQTCKSLNEGQKQISLKF